jgi:hypothetical protein
VKAAKEMHEAKLLAEGGFKGSERMSLEQRYERAEKDLFTRMEGLGREIENRVTGNDSSRLKDQGLKAETTSAADYGSAEHHEKFAGSPANFRRQRKPDSRPPRPERPAAAQPWGQPWGQNEVKAAAAGNPTARGPAVPCPWPSIGSKP